MASKKRQLTIATHKDLDFEVSLEKSGSGPVFKTFDEAAGEAVSIAVRTGRPAQVDVICWSRAAAKTWGCLDEYDADPEASVTERIVISADNKGHIP